MKILVLSQIWIFSLNLYAKKSIQPNQYSHLGYFSSYQQN
jgi:hypothetical protein